MTLVVLVITLVVLVVVITGNDSGSACVWLKQLTLHSATRFQHSLFMIEALQLVYSWVADWCSEAEEWWGPWRRTDPQTLKALRCTSSRFARRRTEDETPST